MVSQLDTLNITANTGAFWHEREFYHFRTGHDSPLNEVFPQVICKIKLLIPGFLSTFANGSFCIGTSAEYGAYTDELSPLMLFYGKITMGNGPNFSEINLRTWKEMLFKYW